MNQLKTISFKDFTVNPFTVISKEWMLITAEKDGKVNAMTASWGGIGHIFGKNVLYFFIRPQRYTKEFVDAASGVSISILPASHRKTLNYFGAVSGRAEDKIAKSGLTVAYENKIPYFAESKTVFICRKFFAQPFLKDSFVDKTILTEFYPENDLHTMYIAEVEEIFVNESLFKV
ncbi:MAG: flavin reductase [Spirochaetaceae bacterium]|jgi:flavin reductase (DIM6/NTAB) family NADH-FMN oxidoreductase RutF|nr:flavin reductase [Spirochaetaceae bacterium]